VLNFVGQFRAVKEDNSRLASELEAEAALRAALEERLDAMSLLPGEDGGGRLAEENEDGDEVVVAMSAEEGEMESTAAVEVAVKRKKKTKKKLKQKKTKLKTKPKKKLRQQKHSETERAPRQKKRSQDLGDDGARLYGGGEVDVEQAFLSDDDGDATLVSTSQSRRHENSDDSLSIEMSDDAALSDESVATLASALASSLTRRVKAKKQQLGMSSISAPASLAQRRRERSAVKGKAKSTKGRGARSKTKSKAKGKTTASSGRRAKRRSEEEEDDDDDALAVSLLDTALMVEAIDLTAVAAAKKAKKKKARAAARAAKQRDSSPPPAPASERVAKKLQRSALREARLLDAERARQEEKIAEVRFHFTRSPPPSDP
jgi:hypothetical protein